MNILTDSDWLVGLLRIGDPHHKKAKLIFDFADSNKAELFALNLVIQETATVLSHRTGMKAVRLFWEKLPKLGLTIIQVDKNLELEAWKIFLKQTKKGTSYVDCANWAAYKVTKLDGIISFDKFYKRMGLTIYD